MIVKPLIKNQYMRLFEGASVLIFISFVLHFSLFGFAKVWNQEDDKIAQQSVKYRGVVHKNDTGGWYYSIKSNKKVLIIQRDIPAIVGNIAFSDSIQALKTAELMIDKLERGVFPPSIFVYELDSLKITY